MANMEAEVTAAVAEAMGGAEVIAAVAILLGEAILQAEVTL